VASGRASCNRFESRRGSGETAERVAANGRLVRQKVAETRSTNVATRNPGKRAGTGRSGIRVLV
jgi:hypothetical protein